MLFVLPKEDFSRIEFLQAADFGTQSSIIGLGIEIEVTEFSI